MSKSVKYKAKKFARQNSLTNITYDKLRVVSENIGYTVIEFNNVFNDNNVETVIKNLKLEEVVQKSRGFTYVDKNYRLIFINEDLTKDEKIIVLSHEIGHVVCKHFSSHHIIGNDVKEEYEANEFSHYLLNQNILQKIQNTIAYHKKISVLGVIIVAVALSSIGVNSFIKRKQSYYGDYYITSTGNKYHKKECIFVKDKLTAKRLTKEDFETDMYAACDMCLPDEYLISE